MNKQPFDIPPRWWPPKLSTRVVRMTRRYRRWKLRSEQRIRDVVVFGGHHLTSEIDAGHGVMVTPNHAAHYDSAALYLAADQLNTPLFFMTAWQVFGMSPKWEQYLMQRMGCFSIDRESADRQSFKQALTILKEEPHPLVIFPEGDIYHITDRVTPFRDGAAAVAISAARKSSRPVSIVPCGIKFWYQDDPTPRLKALMSKLEKRLLIRPEPDKPLVERIYRFAEALLALKEVEYTGKSQSGPITERIRRLADTVLRDMELRHEIEAQPQIPERVKALRQAVIRKSDQAKRNKKNSGRPALQSYSKDMDDLFFVMQLYSYPGDYLIENPSIERLSETLDKFEEDVLDRDIPRYVVDGVLRYLLGLPLKFAQNHWDEVASNC